MAVLEVYQRFEVEINGVKYCAGSRSNPKEITVGDDFIYRRNTLAADVTWDAWRPVTNVEEALLSFDFGWIESDIDGVLVELMCDAGGAGQEEFVIELRAGLALPLGIDDSLKSYTADFGGGTADVIDGIRIRNPLGAASSAKCVLALFSA